VRAASHRVAHDAVTARPVRRRPERSRALLTWLGTCAPHTVIGLLVVALLASPLYLTHRAFDKDFTNSIWLGWVRGTELTPSTQLSYFVNSAGTYAFDPIYAFYGGPVFTLLGALDRALGGHMLVAFELMTTATLAATYAGVYRLARCCTVPRNLAHLPALTYVTGAYYLTDLYGRGDWTEFMAISTLPALAAAVAVVARDQALRFTPLAALFVATIVVTGSHNLVLSWALFLSAVLAVVALVVGWRPRLPRANVVAILCTMASAIALNGWALVPDVVYGGRTAIAALPRVESTPFFDSVRAIFSPIRYVPSQSTTPALYVQIPVIFLATAVLTVFAYRRSVRGNMRRGLVLAIGLVALPCTLAMTNLWTHLPAPLSDLQFGYRLMSFATLGVAGVVGVAVLAYSRSATMTPTWARRATLGLFASVALVNLAMATAQIWVRRGTDGCPSRSCALVSPHTAPPTWYAGGGSYSSTAVPIRRVGAGRVLTINPARIRGAGNGYRAVMDVPPGLAPIQTNVTANPDLVAITGGVKVVGRSDEDTLVVQRLRKGSGPVLVDVHTASSVGVVAGQTLTDVGLAATSLLLVLYVARRWRARRHA